MRTLTALCLALVATIAIAGDSHTPDPPPAPVPGQTVTLNCEQLEAYQVPVTVYETRYRIVNRPTTVNVPTTASCCDPCCDPCCDDGGGVPIPLPTPDPGFGPSNYGYDDDGIDIDVDTGGGPSEINIRRGILARLFDKIRSRRGG